MIHRSRRGSGYNLKENVICREIIITQESFPSANSLIPLPSTSSGKSHSRYSCVGQTLSEWLAGSVSVQNLTWLTRFADGGCFAWGWTRASGLSVCCCKTQRCALSSVFHIMIWEDQTQRFSHTGKRCLTELYWKNSILKFLSTSNQEPVCVHFLRVYDPILKLRSRVLWGISMKFNFLIYIHSFIHPTNCIKTVLTTRCSTLSCQCPWVSFM